MIRLIDGYCKWIDRINKLFTYLAGALVPIMILIVVQDVIRRYVFNDPTTWALDIARFMMVYVFFLALGPTLSTGHHISTDFFTEKYSEKVMKVMQVITGILTIIFSIVLLVQLTESTWEVFVTGKLFSTTNSIPMKYVYVITPIGTLQFLLTAIALLIKPLTKKIDRNEVETTIEEVKRLSS